MGKLIIDGNKVYTVDEACLKRKNLTLPEHMQEVDEAVRQMRRKQRYMKKER